MLIIDKLFQNTLIKELLQYTLNHLQWNCELCPIKKRPLEKSHCDHIKRNKQVLNNDLDQLN